MNPSSPVFSRPNPGAPSGVLVLLADQLEGRMLGCAGHPRVRTPNLDALAARGTRFANAWTPSPVCVPARAALATGRWVHQTGYWDNATGYDGRIPGWGRRLQQAGMRVESVGKLHYRDGADPTGFDRQILPAHVAGPGQVWGSVRDPMPEVIGRSPLYDEMGAGESSYNRFDRKVADEAIRWLEQRASEPQGDPWVLFCGFVAPHFPLVVPQRWLDQYPPDAMSLPGLLPRDGFLRHPWVERQARHMDHDESIGSDARRRLALSCYHALTSFLDHLVGEVLDALERLGLARDTLVIFSSDHGDNQGKRGMWNKCLLYRESTGIPLLLAGPGVPAGKVTRTHAGLVDLHPTVLDALRLECEPGLPGRSLIELAGAQDDPDRIGFSEYHAVGAASGAYMLARGQWKYHHYVGYRPELFDLERDPDERHDLASDPRHAGILKDMERRLRELLDPEAVDRRAKDDQNALIARFGGREAAMRTGTPGATPVPA